MPKERFDKDIELVKLQIKISNEQTHTYSLFGGAIALIVGLLAVAYSSPPVLLLIEIRVAIVICLCLSTSVATYSLFSLSRFYRWVRSDVDKIYDCKQIDF